MTDSDAFPSKNYTLTPHRVEEMLPKGLNPEMIRQKMSHTIADILRPILPDKTRRTPTISTGNEKPELSHSSRCFYDYRGTVLEVQKYSDDEMDVAISYPVIEGVIETILLDKSRATPDLVFETVGHDPAKEHRAANYLLELKQGVDAGTVKPIFRPRKNF